MDTGNPRAEAEEIAPPEEVKADEMKLVSFLKQKVIKQVSRWV